MCEYCKNDKELLNKRLPLLKIGLGIEAYIATNHLGVMAYISDEQHAMAPNYYLIKSFIK